MKKKYDIQKISLWKKFILSWGHYSLNSIHVKHGISLPLSFVIFLLLYIFLKENYIVIHFKNELLYSSVLMFIIIDFYLARGLKKYSLKHLNEMNKVNNKLQIVVLSTILVTLLLLTLIFLLKPYL
jgi:ACR3 family arsenite efflux pump ArsB